MAGQIEGSSNTASEEDGEDGHDRDRGFRRHKDADLPDLQHGFGDVQNDTGGIQSLDTSVTSRTRNQMLAAT